MQSLARFELMCHMKYDRPWHDAQVIDHACAVTHTNQEKGDLGR